MLHKTLNSALVKSGLLTLTVTVLISTGCKKQITESGTQSNVPVSGHVSLGSTTNWADAANSNNPYDDVGLKHNLALKNITDNLTIDEMYTISDVYDEAVNYARTVYSDSDVDDVENTITANDISNVLGGFSDCCEPTVQDLKDMIDMGSGPKAYIEGLIDELYTFGGSDPSFSSFMTTVTAWEDDIEAQGFTTAEEQALYMYGSTLRYSYNAWINADLPDFTSQNAQLKTTGKLFRWIATALFDAGGAVIGSGLGPAGAVIAGAACSGGAFAVCAHNGW